MTIVFVLTLVWGQDAEISVSPKVDTYQDSMYVAVEPLQLSWSPVTGFGAASYVTVEPQVTEQGNRYYE